MKSLKMKGAAMENTILEGQTRFYSPSEHYVVNDIVVFRNYPDNAQNKIKNSVFRIVGTTGDTVEFKEGLLYVNNKRFQFPSTYKRWYFAIVTNKIKSELDKEYKDKILFESNDTILLNLTIQEAQTFKEVYNPKQFRPHFFQKQFPHIDVRQRRNIMLWNRDFYGPIVIPKIGDSIERQFLNNEVEGEENVFVREPVYFVVGDNFQDAIDSRNIGLIKKRQVLGKIINN